jgi:hypothetical protein
LPAQRHWDSEVNHSRQLPDSAGREPIRAAPSNNEVESDTGEHLARRTTQRAQQILLLRQQRLRRRRARSLQRISRSHSPVTSSGSESASDSS